MAHKTDLRGCFSGLNSLFRLKQKFAHTMAEGRMQEKVGAKKGANLYVVPGQDDISKWKKVDARTFGIKSSIISQSSWIVLKVLRDRGFEAYLVGGCVRDLILKRTPKDFDVITTAGLKQIKRSFNQAYIIGRRFPICQVNLKGSSVEVSSFKGAANQEGEEPETNFPKLPKGCSKIDFVRWRDCAQRDFTINSMFYDPFANEIYDYANAMGDLKLSKMQTITPAHMSFTEDCARILRGLRIAARLGFSFSKEIETAIHELSSSISSLNKVRLMMEMNYMLSYGAAEPSLQLLRRFKLLKFMLPFHDAYLNNHSGDPETPSSSMLMKLLSSLDKVTTCGQPCDSLLWIGLLAFHLALVTNPQQPLMVWTFSALLYHGSWNEGVKAARQHALDRVDFEPEILKSFNHLSDEELAQKVSEFASIVQDSINILSDADCLHDAMADKYPSSPRSRMAFVSRRLAGEGARLFDVLVHDIQSSKNKRESYKINHVLLGKGDIAEVSFVLGKIIMDTLSGGVVTDKGNKAVNNGSISPSNGETALTQIMKRKLNEKEREVGKKSKDSTVLQEQADSASRPIKKQKLIQKEDKKLASSPAKKPKLNIVSQEQFGSALEIIKKQKLIQKENKTVMKEREPSQKHTTSSILKPKKDTAPENKGNEESKVKEKKKASRLSSLFK